MQSELEKGILRYVDSSIENAPYTQIYTGLIKASGVDGYTIDLNGVEYTNVPSKGSFSTNDTVKVVIPNNQPSNMFILAESTGGGTGAVSSVNGMTGDVVISNVANADKLSSAKTITLSGDATGSVSTDFSTNPTISLTVVDDSHNHIISNVDGLQTALDGKSPIDSPTFTGAVTAPRVASTVATGTAPLTVTSTTLVTNLNADLLDGLNSASTNTASTIVARDSSGNFSAGTITANLTGNSSTSTKLATARNISLSGDVTGSVSFDGSGNSNIVTTVVDDSHNHIISNVDNLQTTLNVKADLVDGKVPSSQLPSFVDDVLEYATLLAFPVTGTSGVIYVDLSTNLAYRWSGTVYVEISPSLALGETSSTAYRGDRGVIAYNHSLSTSNPHSTTASQVGLGNVPNVTTNNQTPTFTMAGTDSNLVSGETLTISFGKIAKAINSLISHIADSVRHITATERTNWNTAYTNNHTHSNKTILDNTTASYTTSEQTKLSGIENGAEVNNISDTNATDLTDGGDTTLHYHATDRNRANHTGTQTSSTISDFASTVRSTVLTGLSTATNAIISATDTVLSAFGKLQAQITANLSTLTTHIGRTDNPHSVTKTQVGLGNVADVLQYSASNPQLNVTGSSGSCTGNSATATALATARTISLSDGAIATATSFDGSANISIPVTSFYESYVKWGGKNYAGDFNPFDAALNSFLGANRLAGINPNGVSAEYSTDNGSTWVDYGASDSNKVALCTTSTTFKLGGPSAAAGNISSSNQLRITLDGVDGGIYTQLYKFHLYMSTNGSSGCTVTIERATYSDSSTFITLLSNQPITGWSGWNVFNFSTIGGSGSFGGTNNSSHNRKLRFTFKNTACNSSYSGLLIFSLYAYGGVGWAEPSYLARYGTPYSYDYAENVTFPSNVIASAFLGNASTATTLQTARTIALSGGATGTATSFNGSANITIPVTSLDASKLSGTASISTTGNATTATTATTTTGNAGSATKLDTARTINLTGDVTGSVSFDGSANVSITSTVVDDSHNHVISNVDNLQTTLDSKLNSSVYNATDVLTKIKTVDGSGSGLDADTVDTYHVNNTLNTGSLWTSDKILSTVETYGSHFDIVQYSGTYAVNDILTMTVPTITNNKSNGIEVLLYRNSAYESALLGIDYTYKYTSATQIQVQFFTAGTYIANYGFYNVGSWILEWQ